MDKVKRERSSNFSGQERDTLVDLVQKYQHVLENKQSDATTWKKKETVWDCIENEFNANSGGSLRTKKTLRVKYEGLKRLVRKKSAAIRSELYRTGGGPSTAPSLDPVEQRIKTMITLSTDGLDSLYDSDVVPQALSPGELGDGTLNQTSLMEEFILIPPATMPVVLVEDDILGSEEAKDANSSDFLQSVNNDQDEKHSTLMNEKALDITPKQSTLTPSTSHKKWDVTSRRNLKSKKHPALATLNQQTSFEKLTQAKIELVELQRKLVEEEIQQKRKEWEFQETYNKLKLEEQILKVEEQKLRIKNYRDN